MSQKNIPFILPGITRNQWTQILGNLSLLYKTLAKLSEEGAKVAPAECIHLAQKAGEVKQLLRDIEKPA